MLACAGSFVFVSAPFIWPCISFHEQKEGAEESKAEKEAAEAIHVRRHWWISPNSNATWGSPQRFYSLWSAFTAVGFFSAFLKMTWEQCMASDSGFAGCLQRRYASHDVVLWLEPREALARHGLSDRSSCYASRARSSTCSEPGWYMAVRPSRIQALHGTIHFGISKCPRFGEGLDGNRITSEVHGSLVLHDVLQAPAWVTPTILFCLQISSG